MLTTKGIWRYLTLIVLGLGLGVFRFLKDMVDTYSIQDAVFRPPLPALAINGALFSLLLIAVWKGLSWLESRLFKEERASTELRNLLCLLPLGFFLFSPLLLSHFITSADLQIRMDLMLKGILTAVFVTKAVVYFRWLKYQGSWDNLWLNYQGLSLKYKVRLLFIAAFAVYLLCTALIVSQGLAFSGDEAYYLVTSHSLYNDRDINVSNNYEDRDFTHFYPKEYYPRIRLQPYARWGRRTGHLYPVNQPGTSVLVLPHYGLSYYFSGRVRIFILKSGLALWAALLGLQIFLLSRDLWGREKLSLGLWALYAFTSPILFYALHLYPEIPIALFSVYIFRMLRRKIPPSLLHLVFLGFLLSLFPWFGLKYNMIFWPLLLISLYLLFKEHKQRARLLLFLAPPLASMVLFYLYVYELYGTYNPIAIYSGILTPAALADFRDVMWNTPIMLRIDSFLDYFLDQRDGLLLYSPLYFFSFLGAVEVFRRYKREFLFFLLLAGPYLFNYAFFAHRQGYSPQGRVLTCISWILILLIGYFLVHNRKKFYVHLFAGAALLSYVMALLLLNNPRYLYQPTTHEFTFRGSELFVSLSNLHFYLPDLLPSFIKVNNLGYLPNYIWLLLILLFVGGYLLKKDIPLPQSQAGWTARILTVLLIFLVWFAFFPRMVLLHPQRAAFSSGERVVFYSLGPHVRMPQPGEFKITGERNEYTFHFTSWRPLQNIQFSYYSEAPDLEMELQMFEQPFFSGKVQADTQVLTHPQPPAYRYRNTNLYLLKIRLEGLTTHTLAETPLYISIKPER
jgi:hypothetical protein